MSTAVPPPRHVGLVLAGGRGRRLAGGPEGAGKAWLEIGGRSFLAHVVAALREVVEEVVVVTAVDGTLPTDAGRLSIVRDSIPDGGPLAGIADGLAAIGGGPATAAVVAVAVDMPLATPAEVRRLLAALDEPDAAGRRADWVVPLADGHPQVLLSALRPALLPRIRAHLATGRRDPQGLLRGLLAESPPTARLVDPGAAAAAGGAPYFDIDEPADLERLSALWRRRGAARI